MKKAAAQGEEEEGVKRGRWPDARPRLAHRNGPLGEGGRTSDVSCQKMNQVSQRVKHRKLYLQNKILNAFKKKKN